MGLWQKISGSLRICIVTADPQRLINDAISSGIRLYDIHCGNDLELNAKIDRSNLNACRKLADRHGCEIRVAGRFGMFWKGKQILSRPAILALLLFAFALTLYLPTRVYFVRVDGNQRIPEKAILEYAQSCGIGFGASRKKVRSEKIKNQLLQSVPQLSWVGINTAGCTAVISVREKEPVVPQEESGSISSIVALCDGVIEQCTIVRGNGICKVGDAVVAGQILVSGYTDCGLMIRATKASAEIFAKTIRNADVICLAEGQKRTQLQEESVRFGLVIGKKQINFYKDSGISHSSCVKMREEVCLALPGGFQLPVSVVKERFLTYETEPFRNDNCPWAESFARAYVQKEMISGSILSEDSTQQSLDGVFLHKGIYHCYEMIGVEKNEEIIK